MSVNNIFPKVLVAIPYHERKRYALDHVMNIVDKLSYPQLEVMMRWDLREYGGKDNVKIQRETFRRLAITGYFDHLFFLGCDTIPPEDVIQRLLSHGKDIIGGVYWGRNMAPNSKVDGAVAWIHDKTPVEQRVIFKESENLINVDGMGMDCVLFSKRVLNDISWMSWPQNDDDYPFYDKAKELGYKIYVDPLIQCKHYFDKDGYTYKGKVCYN